MYNDESDELNTSEPLELILEFTFANLNKFKDWINGFALKEGFSYKIRTSKIDQDVMWRATYECTKSGSHVLQSTLNFTKQRSIHFQ